MPPASRTPNQTAELLLGPAPLDPLDLLESSMRPFARANRFRFAASVAVVACLAAAESSAIEMFTYFGDGSRIGLPSLEVPIEAYPGIPLRSDRLRARRRAMRMGPDTVVQARPPGAGGGITIRSMPPAQAAPQPDLRQALPQVVAEEREPANDVRDDQPIEPLVAPEPEPEAEAPAAPISPP